jgi:uncharacterized protein YkwD
MPSTLLRRAAATSLCLAGILVPAATSSAAPEKGVDRTVRAKIALGAAKSPARARAAQDCANADIAPTAANAAAVRAAILCLHNQIRAERGLPALKENGRLRKAAARHSSDMVGRGYFEHTAPGGVTMVDRIRAARYVPRNAGWALGENLAWGTGRLATPRSVMRSWMESPGHRANILKRAYREIGIGVVIGTPSAGGAGATYTADFGVIRR